MYNVIPSCKKKKKDISIKKMLDEKIEVLTAVSLYNKVIHIIFSNMEVALFVKYFKN